MNLNILNTQTLSMIRNRLLLTQIFSILMLGIGLALLLFAWAAQDEINHNQNFTVYPPNTVAYESSPIVWLRNLLFGLSAVFILPALGLLKQKKWARMFFIALFWLMGFLWIAFLLVMNYDHGFRSNKTEIFLLLSLCSVILSIPLAVILYLDNTYVCEQVEGEEAVVNFPDVLDH